jgi:hypothetical protein
LKGPDSTLSRGNGKVYQIPKESLPDTVNEISVKLLQKWYIHTTALQQSFAAGAKWDWSLQMRQSGWHTKRLETVGYFPRGSTRTGVG